MLGGSRRTASLPALTHRVLPDSDLTGRLVHMAVKPEHRLKRPRSRACTAVEPQGTSRHLPPEMTGRSWSSSNATVSIAEPCGGTWVMSTAEPGSSALATRARRRSSSSSSSSSRGVSHGVGLARREPNQLASVGRRTTRLSALITPVAPLEQRVDLIGIVVARNQIERRAALGEPLGGELHPGLQPSHDRLQKPPFKDAPVVKLGELLFAHGDAYRPLSASDRSSALSSSSSGPPVAPTVTAVPASVGLHEGNERLAREVAGNQHSVRLPDAETNGV